jgi:hypothetical protein
MNYLNTFAAHSVPWAVDLDNYFGAFEETEKNVDWKQTFFLKEKVSQISKCY